jgi:membrane protease subunit (stomatin/prohibitin family)
MQTIQRPHDAAGLVWLAPGVPYPINCQLVVAENECIVAALDGVVLGVVPSGTHWLHPQPFPFLASAIVSNASIRAELWFVKTTLAAQFGGSLGEMVDPVTEVECSPRALGDYSLKVSDPARLVAGCIGQRDATGQAMSQWAANIVFSRVREVVGNFVGVEGKSILDQEVTRRLAEEVPRGGLERLEQAGLAFGQLGNVTINFSDEDFKALRAAAAARARKRMEEAKAAIEAQARGGAQIHCARCGTGHDGGRFCTACGQPLPA